MKTKLKTWMLGFKDGFKQCDELSSGMTWEQPELYHLNEIYDNGVNAGQFWGALIKHGRKSHQNNDC